MATRRKKPRISFGFSPGGRSNLINAMTPSVEEQQAEAAKKATEAAKEKVDAKVAEQKAVQARSRELARIFKSYQEGDATFSATESALRAAEATETDPELKSILKDYVRDTKNTKLSRDINRDIEAFNAGGSYAQLQQALAKYTTDNETIRGSMQKALDGARKAENAREITRLGQEYSAGRLDINQYTSQMTNLRNAPGQKDPNELVRIDAAITAAVDNERDLNDRMTYNRWQNKEISADAALAYFNSRMASAKTPKDQNAVQAFVTNIRKYQQDILAQERRRGNATAGNSLKAIDASADADMKDFYEKVVVPGVVAAAGNPELITALYADYGRRAQRWSELGGTKAQFYAEQAERAWETGRIVAANEVTKRILTDIKDLQSGIETARTNKALTPKALIARLTSMAEKAAEGEEGGSFGGWTTPAQKDLLNSKRLEAWRQVNAEAEQLLVLKDDAQSKAVQAIGAAFSDASRAIKADPKGALARELRDSGVLQPVIKDGKPTGEETFNKNKFSEWIQDSPEENALLVFESANKRKDAQFSETYEKGRTGYVETVVQPLVNAAQSVGLAREALVQAGYIKSPSSRGYKPGFDFLDATLVTDNGPLNTSALPLDLPRELLSNFDVSKTFREQEQERLAREQKQRDAQNAIDSDPLLGPSGAGIPSDGGFAAVGRAIEALLQRRYIGPSPEEMAQRDAQRRAAARDDGIDMQRGVSSDDGIDMQRGSSGAGYNISGIDMLEPIVWEPPTFSLPDLPPSAVARGEYNIGGIEDTSMQPPSFDWSLPTESEWAAGGGSGNSRLM